MAAEAKQAGTKNPPNSPTEQKRKKLPAIKQLKNKVKKSKGGGR